MWFIGLDVHHKQSTYCMLDAQGNKVGTRTVKGPWDKVLLELAALKEPFAVCFEATTGFGVLYRRLAKLAQRVVVAHPGHLRLIFRSKRKSDRVDAEKLAKLLFLDEVPAVHVPSAQVQAWRGMIEYRQRVLATRTRVKNQLRALLRGQGLTAPKGLWTRAGLAWLKAQAFETAWDGLRRDDLLEQLVEVNRRLKKVTQALDAYGQNQAGVALLRTIPGVGPRTAEAVLAYLDDVQRFSRGKEVASYFGLIPCQDQSAGSNRLGHITRQGPGSVRKLLVEASWQGIRHSPTIQSYFARIRGEDPDRRKIALVATAHYLLRVMFTMLRTGECWRETVAQSTAA